MNLYAICVHPHLDALPVPATREVVEAGDPWWRVPDETFFWDRGEADDALARHIASMKPWMPKAEAWWCVQVYELPPSRRSDGAGQPPARIER